MTEKEDVRKFDKWVGEWDRNNGKGLLSHPRLVNAFLAGLKAGREEWEKKVEELRIYLEQYAQISGPSRVVPLIALNRIFGKDPEKSKKEVKP